MKTDFVIYPTQQIPMIRVIKTREMRGAGQVISMDEKRNAYRILVSKAEGMNH